MMTNSDVKALEAERGYQAGIGTEFVGNGTETTYVAESLEPNPDLRGIEAIRTWDTMSRTDDQVGSAVRALRTPALSAKWDLEASEDVSADVVEFVRRNIGLPSPDNPRNRREHQGIVFKDHLAQAFKSAIFGYYAFEQVYEYSNPAKGGDGYVHLKKLGPRDPTTIERIEIAADGGLSAIVQMPPVRTGRVETIPEPRRITVEKLVFYCLNRDGADWYGTSVLRQAYRPWFIKDRLERLDMQISERNGMGVPVGYAGTGASVDELRHELSRLRAGASSFLVVPHGTEVKLMGVSGSTVDLLPKIQYYSQQISKSLAQGFQDLGHDAGARSLGETFLEVALRASQEIADMIADTFTEHVIRDLVWMNFGDDTPYPVLTPGDIVATGKTDPSVFSDLVSAKLLTPDDKLEEFLRGRYGLPEADTSTAREVAQVATPTSGTNTQGNAPVLGLSDNSDTIGRLEKIAEQIYGDNNGQGSSY